MQLSIIIPAHNEEKVISGTVHNLYKKLCSQKIVHEILIINDNSTDNTKNVIHDLLLEINSLIKVALNF